MLKIGEKSRLFLENFGEGAETTSQADVVRGEILFLKREEKWQWEKPYRIRYKVAPEIPRTNMTFEPHNVNIYDMRKFLPSLSVFTNGFEVVSFPTQMHPTDWSDPAAISSVYLRELEDFLVRKFGAKHAKLLPYEHRKRHNTFPRSTGKNYDFAQPNSGAHIDVTTQGVREIVHNLYQDQAAEILASRVMCVTLWRLIKGSGDWPLALADATSVNEEEDVADTDAVYSTVVTENCMMHHNPNTHWYYLSDQKESEMLLFMGADSDASAFSAAPHGSFQLRKSEENGPRESIDIRALVFFADIDYREVGYWGEY